MSSLEMSPDRHKPMDSNSTDNDPRSSVVATELDGETSPGTSADGRYGYMSGSAELGNTPDATSAATTPCPAPVANSFSTDVGSTNGKIPAGVGTSAYPLP